LHDKPLLNASDPSAIAEKYALGLTSFTRLWLLIIYPVGSAHVTGLDVPSMLLTVLVDKSVRLEALGTDDLAR